MSRRRSPTLLRITKMFTSDNLSLELGLKAVNNNINSNANSTTNKKNGIHMNMDTIKMENKKHSLQRAVAMVFRSNESLYVYGAEDTPDVIEFDDEPANNDPIFKKPIKYATIVKIVEHLTEENYPSMSLPLRIFNI